MRFYQQIAPVIGVRVPACYQAEITATCTLLVLEDLSTWTQGADPAAHARLLADLHARWVGIAPTRWPWLRPVGAAVDLVAALYDRAWPALAARRDLPAAVRDLGERLVGRVPEAEQAIAAAGPLTLVHGDASEGNVRTSTEGEVALLDFEDVSAAPGIIDLAWLLLSSVDPDRWDETIAAYASPAGRGSGSPAGRGFGSLAGWGVGSPAGLVEVFPAISVQALLSLAGTDEGSAEAAEWIGGLLAAQRRLA